MVDVTPAGESKPRSYETSTRYYTFTGLGGLILGPFAGINWQVQKKEDVLTTLHLYYRDIGIKPDSESKP